MTTCELKAEVTSIQIGRIVIQPWGKDHVWLRKEDGEGMAVKTEEFERLLVEWYDREF